MTLGIPTSSPLSPQNDTLWLPQLHGTEHAIHHTMSTRPACPKPRTEPAPAPTRTEVEEMVTKRGWDGRRSSGHLEAVRILQDYQMEEQS